MQKENERKRGKRRKKTRIEKEREVVRLVLCYLLRYDASFLFFDENVNFVVSVRFLRVFVTSFVIVLGGFEITLYKLHFFEILQFYMCHVLARCILAWSIVYVDSCTHIGRGKKKQKTIK